MTAESLRSQTRKQLEFLARRDRIPGCHDMTKDELIAALVAQFRSSAPPTTKLRRQPSAKAGTASGPKRSTSRRVAAETTSRRATAADSVAEPKGAVPVSGAPGFKAVANGAPRAATLASSRPVVLMNAGTVDSITAHATDPHWLSVQWTISQGMARRAEVALGRGWRTAVPILRLYDATSDDDRGSARTWVRDEEIRGSDPQWYLRVETAGRTWIVEIGFRAADGSYFRIAHSAPSTTPTNNGMRFTGDSHGQSSNGHGPNGRGGQRGLSQSVAALIPKSVLAARLRTAGSRDSALSPSTSSVQLRTELLVSGVAHPDASVTLMNQPIPLGPDGSFALRLPLEGGREVIPADIISPDGSEQRTVILTIDQNVRHLEPQVFDENAE